MSLWGIGKGLVKTVTGIVEGDGEKVLKGLAGTALSTAGTVITHVVHEELGKHVSKVGEKASDS